MPKFFAAAFRGLWLGDALSSLALALVFAAVSLLPRLSSRPLIMLIAVGPIAVAIAIFVTMGNFYAGYLTMLAGLAALSGAVLHQDAGADIRPH
jgi:hypothetical protein